MVAIKKSDVERFVAAPPDHLFLFLLHGADAGLVRESALRLVGRRVDDRHDPFQFVELSGDAVAADPLTLIDEANTAPLFGGRRALLVEAGAKSIAEAIEMLLRAPPVDCSVIVTAGALRKDAPLRKLVESSKLGAALDCAPDSDADVAALIERSLAEASLAIAPEARALLQAALGEDRLMSRAELQKLLLYMDGRERIEAADVAEIVAHASSIAMDAATLEAFSGDMRGAEVELDDGADKGRRRHATDFRRLALCAFSASGTKRRRRHGREKGRILLRPRQDHRCASQALEPGATAGDHRAAARRANAGARPCRARSGRGGASLHECGKSGLEGVETAAMAKLTSRQGRNRTLYSHAGANTRASGSTRTDKIDFAQRPHRGIRR